jgi:regulator of sirC expression with transglutaminase-like and TPR domain
MASGANLRPMEPNTGLIEFAEVVARDDLPLDHAALLIGAWDYPERDIARYRERLDAIAKAAAPDVARATSGIARARAISDCLFERLGFSGNTSDYYDPRNCFLTEVLERRTGIPISLSVLYLEVARRVGVLA